MQPKFEKLNDQEFKELIDRSKSFRQVYMGLGYKYKVNGRTERKIRERIASIYPDHKWVPSKKLRKPSYTNEQLEIAVKESVSWHQVAERLGQSKNNGKNLMRVSMGLGLDFSHFKGQGWNKNNFKPFCELKNKDAIREYLFRNRGHQCEICGISKWLDKPISLEVDHINGDRIDNREENLRILCPNCHSQTPTYRNRAR